MDSPDPSTSSTTPRQLLRSATWSARSSPTSSSSDSDRRPPKPLRLVLPPLLPLSAWPLPSSSDLRPSTPSSDHHHHLSPIALHLFLGSDSAARDLPQLRRHGITHVLNCVASSCPNYFPTHLLYHSLFLHDSPAEDLTSILYDSFDLIETVRKLPNGRILVHCLRGASRSAAIVTAYLMWRHSMPFEDALRSVRAARPAADPNLGFAAQLLQVERRLVGKSDVVGMTPPGVSVRVYRMAPHSPFAATMLVPKTVEVGDGCNAHVLDSRGAFVVHHLPFGIYVWVGSGCESEMAAAADKAAKQIVRYERVSGPIVTVREGTEHTSFWNALNSEREYNTGKRRVLLYDLDYDIFRRALKGRDSPSMETSTEKTFLARGTGWSQLRRRFFSSGVKELVKTVVECGGLDGEESPPRTSWSPESSRTPSPVSADTPSTLSTFSPNSSTSSDWYHLSPPRSDLGSEEEKSKDSLKSIAQRRGSNAPSLLLLPPADVGEGQPSPSDAVRDWCLSPPFVGEVDIDQDEADFGRRLTLDVSDREDTEENDDEFTYGQSLIHPMLYQWPNMDEVEEIDREVLDSKSIFVLLAPDLRRSKGRNLYIWVGKELGTDTTIGEKEEEHVSLGISSTEVLERLELPMDVPVQIIREGQEPEEFLNHIFSFHAR